jgi:hypothetical protein
MVPLSTEAVPADAFKLPCSEALCMYKMEALTETLELVVK